MTAFLSVALLIVCVGLLLTNFVEIKKSHQRNGR